MAYIHETAVWLPPPKCFINYAIQPLPNVTAHSVLFIMRLHSMVRAHINSGTDGRAHAYYSDDSRKIRKIAARQQMNVIYAERQHSDRHKYISAHFTGFLRKHSQRAIKSNCHHDPRIFFFLLRFSVAILAQRVK